MISESMFISLKVGKTKLVCISERLTDEIINIKTIFGAMGNLIFGHRGGLGLTRYTSRKGSPLVNSQKYTGHVNRHGYKYLNNILGNGEP